MMVDKLLTCAHRADQLLFQGCYTTYFITGLSQALPSQSTGGPSDHNRLPEVPTTPGIRPLVTESQRGLVQGWDVSRG